MFAPVQGKFSFQIGLHTGVGEFGRVVVCPPNTDFARTVMEPLSFHFFHFRVEAASLSQREIEGSLSGWLDIGDHARVRSTYRFIGQPGLQPELLEHFLNDLWLLATTKAPGNLAVLSDTTDPLMEEAKKRIAKSAFGPISLRTIASSLALTPVQLTRRFRSAFGVAPLDFLTELRLEKACLLLSDTYETLEEIAGQCGYESGYYLSRLFRGRKGVSPSEYRRRFRV
ncbi:helix-turn-helix domain-containing protein [Cohnella suwonensis]|uniref:Helix-turn-helix domain-containing protein n=1 Tax=Cohnella suwonensis TaxID=696072 RepID=A0ABW0M023_9BACL